MPLIPKLFSSVALLLLSLLFFLAVTNAAPIGASESGWQEIILGKMVRLEVEHKLYQQEGAQGFFIHLRVTSLSNAPLGVDFRNSKTGIPFPNQWGFLKNPRRGIISERRMIPEPLVGLGKDMLMTSWKAKKLEPITPLGSLDFFVQFNGAALSIDGSTSDPHCFISLDGSLTVASQHKTEQLFLNNDASPAPATDLFISTPVRLHPIPSKAKVFTR